MPTKNLIEPKNFVIWSQQLGRIDDKLAKMSLSSTGMKQIYSPPWIAIILVISSNPIQIKWFRYVGAI